MNDLHQIRLDALSEALAHRTLVLNDLKRAEQAVDDAWEALSGSLQGPVLRSLEGVLFGSKRASIDDEDPFS